MIKLANMSVKGRKNMSNVKFLSGENVPLEMHKVRMVQKVNLLPVEERYKSMGEAGYNTFLLRNRDVLWICSPIVVSMP